MRNARLPVEDGDKENQRFCGSTLPAGLVDNSFVCRAGFAMLGLQLFGNVGVRFIEPGGSHECDPYNYCLGNWVGVLLPPFNRFRAVSEVELPEAGSG